MSSYSAQQNTGKANLSHDLATESGREVML